MIANTAYHHEVAHHWGWPGTHDWAGSCRGVAEDTKYRFVLMADIADFYNQIAVHRVPNGLEDAGVPTARAANFEKFLLQLNTSQSRGIPVGPLPSILDLEHYLEVLEHKPAAMAGSEPVQVLVQSWHFCSLLLRVRFLLTRMCYWWTKPEPGIPA